MLRNRLRFLDSSNWTEIGGQAGSTPGGVFADERGDRWYVKTPRTDDHARNELLANRLYVLAGVKVPDVELTTRAGRLAVASRIVKGVTLAELPSNWATRAGEDFAADAWLANRDALGADMDNMIVTSGGDVVRIDQGGALRYRAQGSAKADFGPKVEEFETLRDPATNAVAASVFGNMTNHHLVSSIGRVSQIDPAAIEAAVRGVYGDTAEAKTLAETLMARRDDLARRARGIGTAD
jgi:hypothetical protein